MSNNVVSKFFTKNLNNANFVISASMGLTKITLLVISGTVTLLGTLNVSGTDSDAVTIPEGAGITLENSGSVIPLDGLTINASAGNVSIVAN